MHRRQNLPRAKLLAARPEVAPPILDQLCVPNRIPRPVLHERPARHVAECYDQIRVDASHNLSQLRETPLDVSLPVRLEDVARRLLVDDVGDGQLRPQKPRFSEGVIQDASGSPHEGPAHALLVPAEVPAHDKDVSIPIVDLRLTELTHAPSQSQPQAHTSDRAHDPPSGPYRHTSDTAWPKAARIPRGCLAWLSSKDGWTAVGQHAVEGRSRFERFRSL